MRFITRQLYQAMQPGSGVPDDRAERDWNKRCEALRRHLAAIRRSLPKCARSLSKVSFHDGMIESASQPSPSEVILVIDASNNPWGPRGRFDLVFHGVARVAGLSGIIGDNWLYEEIDLDPGAAFRFSVLLERTEFEIVANDVEIREHAE